MLSSLRSTLVAAEGGAGRLATVAFAGGVAMSVSMMLTVLPHAQAAFDRNDTSDTSIEALVHMGDAFFGGVELFAIPLTLATALVALRFGALPRWFAWCSVVLALVFAIPPVGWLGVFVGLPLWTLVVSVLLWMRQAGEPAVAGSPTAMD